MTAELRAKLTTLVAAAGNDPKAHVELKALLTESVDEFTGVEHAVFSMNQRAREQFRLTQYAAYRRLGLISTEE